MENHLTRVLRLVQKTGDTMVVVDKEGADAFVVMDLDQYELLLDSQLALNEDPEIQLEKSEKEDRLPDIWDVMKSSDEDGETWDIDQLSEGELAELEKHYEAFANRHVQEAIEETVDQTGGRKDDSKELENNEGPAVDDEYGEEQFYLEPVE